MAKQFDGVVEAVRFSPQGQILTVRVYERRSAAFSDCVLLSRAELLKNLEDGKTFVVGKRIPSYGNRFEVARPLHLVKTPDKNLIISTRADAAQDELEGVPLF